MSVFTGLVQMQKVFFCYLLSKYTAKLRYAANVSHRIYGICNIPAVLLILLNFTIITSTKTHKSTSQINEKRKISSLKKNSGQKKFTRSCKP